MLTKNLSKPYSPSSPSSPSSSSSSTSPSSSSSSSSTSSLLACAALALAGAGCGLIKVNGKPLGSSSHAPPSGEHRAAPGEASGPPAGKAARGPAAAAAARPAPDPALCKSSSGDSGGTVAELEQGLRTKDAEYAAAALVDALCTTEGELADERARVSELGQAWMDRHHLDDRDVAVLHLMSRGRAEASQDPDALPGPVGEYGKVTGKPFERMIALDKLGEGASAMARVALVRSCFELGLGVYQPEQKYPLLTSILCTREPIDLARAEAEIDATEGLNDTTRYQLRTTAWRASEAVRLARPALAALGEEDPGVRQLLAIADRELAQWTAPSPRRAELISQLAAMEAAAATNKRSAFAGCQARTVAAWEATLAGVKLPPAPQKNPASTYLQATLASPEGYLAYAALRLCSASAETQRTRPRYDAVAQMQLRRGWRTSTVASWFAAAETIAFDDRGLGFGELAAELGMPFDSRYEGEAHEGVIAGVTDVEGGVEVTFKTVREPRIACTRWRRTHRIQSISAGGAINYEELCVASGKVMMDLTAEPVRFGKAMAHGLEPGMFLVAVPGLPVVATRSASAAEPLFVLGAALR